MIQSDLYDQGPVFKPGQTVRALNDARAAYSARCVVKGDVGQIVGHGGALNVGLIFIKFDGEERCHLFHDHDFEVVE